MPPRFDSKSSVNSPKRLPSHSPRKTRQSTRAASQLASSSVTQPDQIQGAGVSIEATPLAFRTLNTSLSTVSVSAHSTSTNSGIVQAVS